MRGLNLCCGRNKFPDCDNVDFNPEFEADLKFDVRQFPWPLEDNTYDEVYLFHAIEHLEGRFHRTVYEEVFRVLKPDGIFFMSYPEFKHIAQFWIDNYRGMRDFWKDTIYGRQEAAGDYHVYPMDTEEVKDQLTMIGFVNFDHKTEQPDVFNSVVRGTKGPRVPNYEQVLQADIDKILVRI